MLSLTSIIGLAPDHTRTHYMLADTDRQRSVDLDDQTRDGRHKFANPMSVGAGAIEAEGSAVESPTGTDPAQAPLLVAIPSSVFNMIQLTSGGGPSPLKAKLWHTGAMVGLWSTGYYGARAWKEIHPVRACHTSSCGLCCYSQYD